MGLLSFAVLIGSITLLAIYYLEMLRNMVNGWFAVGERVATEQHRSRHTTPPGIIVGTEDRESTPKALPSEDINDVPTLLLSSNHEANAEEDQGKESSVPSFPALDSAQRASQMPPPSRPVRQSRSNLMPPPSGPSNILRPNSATSLRLPTTGPLPNRGPPVGSQQRVSSGLSPNASITTQNTRGKVILSPGHSPMDWAALTRRGDLAGVTSFQRVTPSQLKKMTGRRGKPAWSSWQGKVYNITAYLPFHPGGEAELMKAAGRDGTKLFMDVHPWVNWENMLGSCLVGVMVPEDYAQSALEDMD